MVSVCARQGSLAKAGAPASNELHASMRGASLKATRGGRHQGFVEYTVEAMATLEEFVKPCAASATAVLRRIAVLLVAPHGIRGMQHPIATIVHTWREEGAVIGGIVRLAPYLAWQVVCGAMCCLICAAIAGRANRERSSDRSNEADQGDVERASGFHRHVGGAGAGHDRPGDDCPTSPQSRLAKR